MKKVILFIAVSLDGYISDKNGGVSWLEGDGSEPENAGSYRGFYETIDTVIMGRNTYDQIVGELSPDDWPYKDKMSYIITHKPQKNKDNICFINSDLTELISKLKSEDGKNIWICGGASIVSQLMKANLIDRFHLSVIPCIVGHGIKLFEGLDHALSLKLTDVKKYNGIVDLIYEKR